jgi:Flp pilus assembly protein TadB
LESPYCFHVFLFFFFFFFIIIFILFLIPLFIIAVEKETTQKWNELKQRASERLKARKLKKYQEKFGTVSGDIYEIMSAVKQKYENNRNESLKNDEKLKLVQEMHNYLKGHYIVMSCMHDISRVIQWMIQQKCVEVTMAIATEISSEIPKLVKTKYAIYVIKSMMDHGGSRTIFDLLIKAVTPHVEELMHHKVGDTHSK